MARSHEEADLQRAVVSYLWLARPAAFWFHVPNGEIRDARTAAMLTAMGVRSGVSDLVFLCVPPAVIELKAPGKRGQVSDSQREFLADCEARGVRTAVCDSLLEVHTALVGWGLVDPRRVTV